MITFNAQTHKYKDKITIPSVTQILKSAGITGNNSFYTEEARNRGTSIHSLCEEYANGNEISIEGEYQPYLKAFADWFLKNSVETISTEIIVDNTIDGFRYAGKYDLLAKINKKNVLVDIKTGVYAKWHTIQIAGYALAVKPALCLVLYIKKDGSYKECYLTPAELLRGITDFKRALKACYKNIGRAI